MKGVSILSIPRLLFLSPAHVWKIPCCHLLRRDALSTNDIAGKETLGGEGYGREGKRDGGGKVKREWKRQTERL